MAIIQEQKIVEQRLDFLFQEKIETMDRLAIIQEKKLLKQRLDFPFKETD